MIDKDGVAFFAFLFGLSIFCQCRRWIARSDLKLRFFVYDEARHRKPFLDFGCVGVLPHFPGIDLLVLIRIARVTELFLELTKLRHGMATQFWRLDLIRAPI